MDTKCSRCLYAFFRASRTAFDWRLFCTALVSKPQLRTNNSLKPYPINYQLFFTAQRPSFQMYIQSPLAISPRDCAKNTTNSRFIDYYYATSTTIADAFLLHRRRRRHRCRLCVNPIIEPWKIRYHCEKSLGFSSRFFFFVFWVFFFLFFFLLLRISSRFLMHFFFYFVFSDLLFFFLKPISLSLLSTVPPRKY